jgi:hypothetical protein
MWLQVISLKMDFTKAITPLILAKLWYIIVVVLEDIKIYMGITIEGLHIFLSIQYNFRLSKFYDFQIKLKFSISA